ncbi:terminase large subunit [Fructilactobacillus cliffordii]|uniref:terminase TerL endonuclease subunit n=1 Tax=Fructilactobacillus cliffordii TaxID=2940299 RepID=UPI00209315E4|nr:terminase TerL endonuclease subunit [Fructilactobacillus cliffordii]USS86485.1 terminase large subunit [Fructilactobacillus cliffordii]
MTEKVDISKTKDVFSAYEQLDFSDIRARYRDPATVYCFDVLDRKILTGYDIQLACFRHLRDLQIQNTDELPFYYDVEEVAHFLKFASICPEAESKRPVDLMDWQKFILSMLQGWRNASNQQKRFSNAIVSVARHNGKTYLMAIALCYAFLIESYGKNNLQFLVSSIDAKQSAQLMGYVKGTLSALFTSDEIRGMSNPFYQYNEEIGIDIKSLSSGSDMIVAKETRNRIVRITFNSGSYDGFHFTTAIGDEFGAPTADDHQKLNSITSGQALSVDNPQFIRISTAYENPNVEFHQTERAVLESVERDYKRDPDYYHFLVLNWAQDSKEETYQEETWAKSNPLINLPGKSADFIESIKNKRSEALVGGSLHQFDNKSMNRWLQTSDNSYLTLDDIERAIVDNFDIVGREVYVGFDGSIGGDNSAISFVYPYIDHGEKKFHIQQYSWIPWHDNGSIEAKEKSDGLAYRKLAQQGFCEIEPDPGLIDYESIFKWINAFIDANQLKVLFFGIDNAAKGSYIEQALVNSTDYPIMAISQVPSELSDPTQWLRREFINQRITIKDDPVFQKSLLNAIIRETRMGIRIDKGSRRMRIDPVDATIDACYQAKLHFTDFAYQDDINEQIKRMSADDVNSWYSDPNNGLV